MSIISSACLTRVIEHLDLNTIESLRDVTRLRCIGFCGSARCGKSRLARSLAGSSWSLEGEDRRTALLMGRNRNVGLSKSTAPVVAETSSFFSTAPISASEAHAMSPTIALSTAAAINGVSAASVTGGLLSTTGGGDGEGGDFHSSSYGTSSIESQIMVLDCRIPWGADGLEKCVASFMPLFVTPASIIVWSNNPFSCSFEDTVVGLYACCSVARQLCAARGSGSPSIYEKPSSLFFINREPPSHQNEEGNSLSEGASSGGSDPGGPLASSTALFKALLLPGGGDPNPTSKKEQERMYHKMHIQRRYPHLLPLAEFIVDFFAKSITVVELEPVESSGAGEGVGGGASTKKEEREFLQQVLTAAVATAWTSPTVDDIRRQLSVLRSSSIFSSGHTSISFGGGSGANNSSSSSDAKKESWSWLSVLETTYSGEGDKAALGSLAGKADEFLLEEALDALHSALSPEMNDDQDKAAPIITINSLEEGIQLAAEIADCYFSSPSSSVAKRYEEISKGLVQQHLDTQRNRIQAAKCAKVEASLLNIVVAFSAELESVDRLVAMTQREEKDVPLW